MRKVLARLRLRVAAVLGMAVVVGLAVWLFAVRGSGGSDTAQQRSSSAAVNARALRALVAALGRPVYWLGPQPGVTYEFTETADGRVYVRYLPAGVRAGSKHPYLTVASYPVVNAFAVTRAAAAGSDEVELPVFGGIGFYAKTRPTNAYVAFPGTNTQIELFDPSAAALRELVAAGRLQPVGRSAVGAPPVQTRAVRTSRSALRTLAAKLHEPIYWLGPLPGRTLELAQAPDGRIDLRYLPDGVAPGSPGAFLAVGTYPVQRAFQATVAASNAPDAVSIPLPNGAVAFYAKAHPTNIYAAFPNVDEQVEIYDPNARVAHQMIAADKLVPVR